MDRLRGIGDIAAMKYLLLLLAISGMAVTSAHAGVDMKEMVSSGGCSQVVPGGGDDSISHLEALKAQALAANPDLAHERQLIRNAAKVLNREQENGFLTAAVAQNFFHWKQCYQDNLWKAMVQIDPQIANLWLGTQVCWEGPSI